MSAKWFCFSLLLLPAVASLQAQEVQRHDTVYIVQRDTVYLHHGLGEVKESVVRPRAYDRRIHQYRERWAGLIPTHLKLQYAGNMGLISVGTGWDYGKRNQWETDLLLGFLPRYGSEKSRLTMTLKQNFIPWSVRLGNTAMDLEPLTCGIYMNTVFGDEFWSSEPDRYPKGYYGFSSRVRFHIFAGQRLTVRINPKHRFFAHEATFFYELSTSDLYVVSAFTNSYLKPSDYLCLSFGVKLQLL